MLTVQLGTCKMIADSNPQVTISSDGSVDAVSVDSKEIHDVNIWDDEW